MTKTNHGAAVPSPADDVKLRKRTCNLHDDCNAADEKAKARGRMWASHCHDDCCEDCFGS